MTPAAATFFGVPQAFEVGLRADGVRYRCTMYQKENNLLPELFATGLITLGVGVGLVAIPGLDLFEALRCASRAFVLGAVVFAAH